MIQNKKKYIYNFFVDPVGTIRDFQYSFDVSYCDS